MTYAVLVRLDAAGACPVIVSEGDELLATDGARWRFVAETDDLTEAIRLHAELRAQREGGEL